MLGDFERLIEIASLMSEEILTLLTAQVEEELPSCFDDTDCNRDTEEKCI